MTIFEYLVGAISISLFGLNFRNDLCQVSAYLAKTLKSILVIIFRYAIQGSLQGLQGLQGTLQGIQITHQGRMQFLRR